MQRRVRISFESDASSDDGAGRNTMTAGAGDCDCCVDDVTGVTSGGCSRNSASSGSIRMLHSICSKGTAQSVEVVDAADGAVFADAVAVGCALTNVGDGGVFSEEGVTVLPATSVAAVGGPVFVAGSVGSDGVSLVCLRASPSFTMRVPTTASEWDSSPAVRIEVEPSPSEFDRAAREVLLGGDSFSLLERAAASESMASEHSEAADTSACADC